MRIAQVTHTFPPYKGGIGNVCYNNSLELAKLGYDVTVFTSKVPDIDHTYPDPLKVKRFRPLFKIGNAPMMPQLLTPGSFDIVHLHYPSIFCTEAVLLNPRLWKSKLIVTFHQDLLFSGVIGSLIQTYDRALKKIVSRIAKKMLVPSLDYAENSSISSIIKYRRDSVLELPNGVDTNRFSPQISGEELRTNHGIGDKSVILFVGGLDAAHRFKGLEILFQAFSRINNRDNAVLIIVGDGSLKSAYQKMADDLSVSPNVIFAGGVTDSDLPKYYALCDLLVLPSTSKAEIFGLVLVEAMATGKPVIASNLPGVRTVVNDGENGILAEPKNVDDLTSKIQFLLDNKSIRQEYGHKGREKVEHKYSWNSIGKNLDKIYLELLT